VRSMLKALGLTIWGVIAFGLVAIFIFVGYEAALKYRASHDIIVAEKAMTDQAAPSGVGAIPPADRMREVPVAPALPRSADATRKLLLGAVQNRQYTSAIEYGRELVDGQSAEPADLSMVAQSYFAIGDCANAHILFEKAKEAFQKVGREPDQALGRVAACCGSGEKQRVVLDAVQRTRIDRLLSKTQAAKAETGGPFVRLGELYYGFAEYELAIASIERGLSKGQVAHLDEAYVYLGLSEQAVGDLDQARDAFARLKDVSAISPRVLRLWTLYAETQLTASKLQSAADVKECEKGGTGGL
jgi:tetratricopeptide (TPR) repeat protein